MTTERWQFISSKSNNFQRSSIRVGATASGGIAPMQMIPTFFVATISSISAESISEEMISTS
jgi:hypothetical protein